jgi:hypothetical protein
VGDGEVVARWVFTPPHVKRPLPGELSDTFFEDIDSNGMSVQRVLCHWPRSRDEVHQLGQKQVANDGVPNEHGEIRAARTYLGAIKFTAKELRTLNVDLPNNCHVRIYDTALPGNKKHAEVMVALQAATKKARTTARQQLRVRLYVLAQKSGVFKSPYISNNDAHLLGLNIAVRDTGFGMQ